MHAKLKSVKTEMRRRMHHPIPEQGRWLARVLQGHYSYYAVPHNGEAPHGFRRRVIPALATGAAASQPERPAHVEAHVRPRRRWLPEPRILHPWPNQRFDARTQGRSLLVCLSRSGRRTATAVSLARCWSCFTGRTLRFDRPRRRIASGDTRSALRRPGALASRRSGGAARQSRATALALRRVGGVSSWAVCQLVPEQRPGSRDDDVADRLSLDSRGRVGRSHVGLQ
jgi:hypothetical protein